MSLRLLSQLFLALTLASPSPASSLFSQGFRVHHLFLAIALTDYTDWHNSHILNPCDGERHKLDDFSSSPFLKESARGH